MPTLDEKKNKLFPPFPCLRGHRTRLFHLSTEKKDGTNPSKMEIKVLPPAPKIVNKQFYGHYMLEKLNNSIEVIEKRRNLEIREK